MPIVFPKSIIIPKIGNQKIKKGFAENIDMPFDFFIGIQYPRPIKYVKNKGAIIAGNPKKLRHVANNINK